jgi:ABC-type amino acid transport substrate-binding protein
MTKARTVVSLAAAAAAVAAGCAPPPPVSTRSRVEVLARAWDQSERLPAGWAEDGATGEVDGWGRPITWELTTTPRYRTLVVRSMGADALPFTGDDVTKAVRVYVGPPEVPPAQRVEQLGEAVSRGFGRGAVRGVREGLRPEGGK